MFLFFLELFFSVWSPLLPALVTWEVGGVASTGSVRKVAHVGRICVGFGSESINRWGGLGPPINPPQPVCLLYGYLTGGCWEAFTGGCERRGGFRGSPGSPEKPREAQGRSRECLEAAAEGAPNGDAGRRPRLLGDGGRRADEKAGREAGRESQCRPMDRCHVPVCT